MEKIALQADWLEIEQKNNQLQKESFKLESEKLINHDFFTDAYFDSRPLHLRSYRGTLPGHFKKFDGETILRTMKIESPQFIRGRLNYDLAKAARKEMITVNPPALSLRGEFMVSGETFPLSRPGYSLGLSLSWDLPYSSIRGSIDIGSSQPTIRERNIVVSASSNIAPDQIEQRRRGEKELADSFKEYSRMEEEITNRIALKTREWFILADRTNLLRKESDLFEKETALMEREMQLGISTKNDYMSRIIRWSGKEMELLESIRDLLLFEFDFLLYTGKPWKKLILETVVPNGGERK